MARSLTQPLEDFDLGRISRRHLLQLLSVAAAGVPGKLLAQATGSTVGSPASARRRRAQRQEALVPPFEPTGWKTVWLDHFSYRCADYEKAAAFYNALMGWKVRSDDGQQAVLDIGENTGGIIIRGGLTGPPPVALTDAGLGVDVPRIQAIWDGFAWGIEPWDTDTVEAELDERGLNPVADHQGSDYRSFRIKDPDGFEVAITNGTKALRRKEPANSKLRVPPPFEPTGWETVYLDHISFEVPDYRRSAAFYQALLGWEVRIGERGGSASARIGDIGGAIIRGNAAARAAERGTAPPPPPPAGAVTAIIGHISFGIANWDKDRVRQELIDRGLVYVNREGEREPRPDMGGSLESYHVPDAMGWDLQIGNQIGP